MADGENPKYLERNGPQCSIFHHKSLVDFPVIEPGLMGGFCNCFEIKALLEKSGGKDKKTNIVEVI